MTSDARDHCSRSRDLLI